MYIYVYIIYICTCMGGIFFQKELFMGGLFAKKCFHGKNLWGGVVVPGQTYDQIMSREGELYK